MGYNARIPGLQATDPGLHARAPGLQATDPGLHVRTPGLQATDPGLHARTPGLQATDPGLHARTSGLQATDPGLQATNPGLHPLVGFDTAPRAANAGRITQPLAAATPRRAVRPTRHVRCEQSQMVQLDVVRPESPSISVRHVSMMWSMKPDRH
jgi:hypothetical protein